MTLIRADRVAEYSTTTGTGSMTLTGSVLGYQVFGSALANGDTCYYVIEGIGANGAPSGQWETGLGTFNAGSSLLVRTTVHFSSAADALVSFAAGTKRVMVALTAQDVADLMTFVAARANHTGTQTSSTISDFSTATNALIAAQVGSSIQAFDTDLATLATNITTFGHSLVDDANNTAARGTLGLGTSATVNTGTSGATIPLLNANNAWSGNSTWSGTNIWSNTSTFNNAAGPALTIQGDRTATQWGFAGLNFRISANSLTDSSTAASGTASGCASASIGTTTFAAANTGVTITNGVTLYIAGPPAAGTNVTITNPYALYINTGNTRLGGDFTCTGSGNFGTSISNVHTFQGNAVFVDSAGACCTIKDSNSTGTAAVVEYAVVDQTDAVVARLGMLSGSNDDLYLQSTVGNVLLQAVGATQATVTVDGISLVTGNWYAINGVQVVAARETGWTADTGTAKKTANATYTGTAEVGYTQATIQTLMNTVRDQSQTIKALKDLLIYHGLAG